MKRIFEPVEIGGLRCANRLVRSATWEGVAAPDGSIGADAYAIYDELARGGVGAIVTGFTSVAGDDRFLEGVMRLHDDALVGQYARLVDVVHAQGVPVIAQLALGGFYRTTPDGSSVRVEADGMSAEEIRAVERRFVDAAMRAEAAGFDGVQIQAAHFLFLSRFMSPAMNHRRDEFGGSNANRARIVTDIVRSIRAEASGLAITAKVNSSDYMRSGLEGEGAIDMCRRLERAGVDSIEVSGNGASLQGVRARRGEAYFAPFAACLAEEVGVPIALVGGLRSRLVMQRVLGETGVELLSLSRPLLRDPAFPRKLEEGTVRESACISCNACYETPRHRCVFRT